MQLPVIRPMTHADVDPIVALFLRQDWGDRRLYLEFVIDHPESQPFVAEADGVVVGTGVIGINGPVGWIGTIFVDPAWRRRGLGLELTRTTIEAADAAGCRTLVLVATAPAGRCTSGSASRSRRPTGSSRRPACRSTTAVDPRIRPFEPRDLAAMAALDATATGEDRAHLLGAFASGETARVLDAGDGVLDGFVVRAPWGGGATIAPGSRRRGGDPSRTARRPRSRWSRPGGRRCPRTRPVSSDCSATAGSRCGVRRGSSGATR